MPYFTIEKQYLFIPFELKVKQKELLNRFLLMLENSGVGDLIQKYVKNDTELGGRPNCNYHRLFASIGKITRYESDIRGVAFAYYKFCDIVHHGSVIG